jgi:hypothetical protein
MQHLQTPDLQGGLPSTEEIRQNKRIVIRVSIATRDVGLFSITGGGDAKHKSTESLIKELGKEREFGASIETVPDGTGRTDVVLSKAKTELTFENLVTTTNDHGLGNIEKMSSTSFGIRCDDGLPMPSILKSLSLHIDRVPKEDDMRRVSFLLPDELTGLWDLHREDTAPKNKTVKGYTVKSCMVIVDISESTARRRAIVQVVTRGCLPSSPHRKNTHGHH